MITNTLLVMVTLLIDLILLPLRALSWIMPTQIGAAVTKFFSYVYLANGIFPMADVMLGIIVLIGAWTLIYKVNIILFIFSLIPWIGKVVKLPNGHGGSSQKRRS